MSQPISALGMGLWVVQLSSEKIDLGRLTLYHLRYFYI